ncbi:hypothetical protein GUITHDRAFT_68151 [Guillardia theta CCMP2712]|uniref:Arginosuccinase n=1 Tax=Guillardia theta (strain CCMP2712) TaxID=905079 RepID=L1JKC6_GUITC|nr:hypothetical protein GUITHDRAFT_68151 [Guillardia theta CCMP2712]EKX48973.1 hypothetical protein GUITHDRAFT_68151 [Guillardia theta CCMP2712]|eukprot:XP_005835953.1 hypothetical protein GUITHDRAFT_68151 [Guillardia theta CCMP2712]
MSDSGHVSSVTSVGFRLSRSGRFSGETDPLMERFNASLPYDKRMWKQDLEGSIAYAAALGRAGILKDDEVKKLQEGLRAVGKEWESGKFEVKGGDEDIHTANERRLTEIVGPVGGKLHTGRSRNDQVVTDVRLWLREEVRALISNMKNLISVATERAEKEMDLLLPGYTHLQRAQPIRWSHWLLCYAWQWKRDVERLEGLLTRVNLLPLGVGALSGHPFGVDRHALAKDLGFDGIIPNSLDAVGDRDFILEYLFASSLIMVHFSRFAEDLILYSSTEFGFVSLADAYSTGSSLMPQKKNPDALELLRGKSGRTIGQTVGLLVTVKGTPSTYNKDLQEDKEPLFDAADTLEACSLIANGVLSTLVTNKDKMLKALDLPMLATDLSDHLVRKGIPFREAHHVAGAVVKLAEDRKCSLDQLTVEDLRKIHPSFDDSGPGGMWDYEAAVERRQTDGGTSRRAVGKQIEELKAWLSQ